MIAVSCCPFHCDSDRSKASTFGLEEFDILLCLSCVAVIFSFWSLWSKNKKKKVAVEKEMEESLKAKLSAWDQRVAGADSVTLHPWDMGRYDRGDGRVYMQEREREKRGMSWRSRQT